MGKFGSWRAGGARAAALAVIVAVLGCEDASNPTDAGATRDRATYDAATNDAATNDAATNDAPPVDTGPADTRPDAGPTEQDADASDSGASDTGSSSDAASALDAPDAPLADAPPSDVVASSDGAPLSDGPPSTGDARPSSCTEKTLYAHPAAIKTFFVLDEGVIVVRDDKVVVIGRDGTTVRSLTSPRPITSAAFDGRVLAVADAAALTMYTPHLEMLAQGLLTSSCRTSAIVEPNVFVCNTQYASGTSYTMFDLATARPLGRSTSTTLDTGDIAAAVPGTSDLLTAEVTYGLTRVLDDGHDVAVAGVQPSNSTGSTRTVTFAFSTPEASSLIDWTGALFRIRGDGCKPAPPAPSCFQADGVLGTLPPTGDAGGPARYLALANGDPGVVLGLVSLSPDIADRPGIDHPCSQGCVLQRIDFPRRAVTAEKRTSLAIKRAVLLRDDPLCHMAVLAYELPPPSSSGAENGGIAIDLVSYGDQQ